MRFRNSYSKNFDDFDVGDYWIRLVLERLVEVFFIFFMVVLYFIVCVFYDLFIFLLMNG